MPHGAAGPPGRALREVSDELVVKPVEAELDAYSAVRAGLAQALR